jgi:hypothetical protein
MIVFPIDDFEVFDDENGIGEVEDDRIINTPDISGREK